MTFLDRDSPLASRESFNRPLSAFTRFVITTAGLSAALFIFGFAIFAAVVMRDPAPVDVSTQADGIIVLTGGDSRILEGARLLQEGRADRLLISGVNSKTTRDDLLKLSGLETSKFNCCVELGYTAQDTVGNAEETRTWAQGRKLKRLIVVTSSYHMPRSLAELAIAMPETEFIPHAVVPRSFRDQAWWLRPVAARLLLSEYVKYLPVAARLKTMRSMAPKAPRTVSASYPATRPNS